MKKKWTPVFVIAGIVLLLFGGAVGIQLVQRYMPSKNQADIGELLGITDDASQAAIYLNGELQEEKGLVDGEQMYLPVTWVDEYVNEKFYWDDVEKMLVYTLPDSIVYADKRTLGSNGQPLVVEKEGQIYLSVGLVSNYTNIWTELYNGNYYDSVVYSRIYVDTDWSPWQQGTASKNTAVRVDSDIKSDVIVNLSKGDTFRIEEQSTDWSRVRTESGYMGYIQNKRIGQVETKQETSLFIEPEYTSISLGEEVSLVWHQVTSMEANSTLSTLMANTQGVNVVAPTWFALTDNDGNYVSYGSQNYVNLAHDMGLQVWAVVDNFNQGTNVDSAVLFAKTSVRKKLIASLMEEVQNLGLDGLNLDIEGIKSSAGPQYVQFIRELSVACRNAGIILSVDNYVPMPYNSFYNWAEQGRVVDYYIIMAYDEHYAGGEAGSVSSISYVENGITDTLKYVPASKTVCALPFYTRVWTESGNETSSSALGIQGAKQWIEDNQVELYWQEELGQYYGSIQKDDAVKEIWMEEETSLGLKMNLISKYQLAGAAFWKLGFEPASVWDVCKISDK